MLSSHEILMLDEPVTGLDPSATAELYEILADLNKQDGMTIIVVSHDIRKTILQSSKILHIAKDSHFFGTPAKYLASKESQMFFGDDN